MTKLLGTVVASNIVPGDSTVDTYGTHVSFLGVGGYHEYLTLAERNAIPIDPLNRLGNDGISTGRRRLGMVAYVSETNQLYELFIDYNSWTGMTSSQQVAALGNNSNWILAGGGSGTGDAIKKVYSQVSHGFLYGQVIGYDGTQFVLKQANAGNTIETIGLVSKVNDANSFTITYAGFIDLTPLIGISANTVYYVSPDLAGALTTNAPVLVGQENRPILITQTTTTGIVVQYRGEIITQAPITGGTGTTNVTGVIGNAPDGTYTDGLFTYFVPSTPIGTAVDAFNEVLKSLAPSAAPSLSNLGNTPVLNSASLSFGVTKNDVGYNNVTTAAGNTAVDINGAYLTAGIRLGVIGGVVSGTLNSNVATSSAFHSGAFNEGDQGQLQMFVNGTLKGSIALSGTSATTSNSRFNLSAVSGVTFPNGNVFTTFKYRYGTFTVPITDMVTGFNYVRIQHTKPSGNIITNYLEWVYDPNAAGITSTGFAFSGLTLTGLKSISGVKYNTGGTVSYVVTINNGYRNVYPLGSAISYPTRNNLTDAAVISKSGTGLTTDISSSRAFPLLKTTVTSPQASSLKLLSVHTLQNNVLGSVGALGNIQINNLVTHPLKATAPAGSVTNTGFLQYITNQGNVLKVEDFTGEVNRLQDRDYSTLTYASVNGGTYAWDGTQSLVGANPQHNTGLLVFNGELMYPNTSYLTSTYGISAGNFGGVANSLVGNPNYSTATGIRVHDRKFTSSNAATQSTMTIQFLHTGTNSSFLTNGGTGGVPSGNFIKVECLIMKTTGAIYGWFNPFASAGNPNGIANTDISSIAGGTSVTCTLSTTPRIDNGDIVIVRIYCSSGWTNRISNINVVNI